MAEATPGAFEQKVSRLENIVRELESGNVDLDNAVRLFNEGKKLARDCELLLKSAQEQIDRAMQAPPEADEEIPF